MSGTTMVLWSSQMSCLAASSDTNLRASVRHLQPLPVASFLQRPLRMTKTCYRESDIDYPGNDLEGPWYPLRVDDVDECESLCANNDNCFAYAFKPRQGANDGHCSIKSADLSLPVPNKGMKVGRCACPPNGCYLTKLVVNAYIGSPFVENLIYSLKGADFTAFADVIFVLAGAPENREPVFKQLREFTSIPDKDYSVVIEVQKHNYDLHGFAALNRHKDHPLVKAAGYLYSLDSVTFDPGFREVFNAFNFKDRDIVYTVPLPNSNIAAFGYGVVENYGNTFEEPISKKEGVIIEHGRGVIRKVKPLPCWGRIHFTGDRQLQAARVLRGNASRVMFEYPRWHLHKYIKWIVMPMPECLASAGCTPITDANWQEHCMT